jgi:hypothetical protein
VLSGFFLITEHSSRSLPKKAAKKEMGPESNLQSRAHITYRAYRIPVYLLVAVTFLNFHIYLARCLAYDIFPRYNIGTPIYIHIALQQNHYS